MNPDDTVAVAGSTAFQAGGGVAIEGGRIQWVDIRFPLLFVVLGLVSAVAIATSPSERSSAIGVVLVLVAITPWLLSMVRIHLRDAIFIPTVMAPVAFLIIFGEDLRLVDFDGGAPQLILMLLIGIVGQVATVADRPTVWATTIAATLIVLAGAISRGDPLDFMPWWIGIFLGVGGGLSFRNSVLRLAELQVAQEALAAQTIADERRRIAREVHDIVAHTMSVTMLHLTAARLALRADPDAAEEALVEAERHGRASMDDIRRVVRLLRTDESSLAAALPSDADIGDLVGQLRAAGSDVRLHRHDDLAAAPAPARLATYRVVQESLSNASRHGRGPIDVSVILDDGIIVTITNPCGTNLVSDTGTGIDGMQERVEALGGTLTAGESAPGVWTVDARIPA